MPEEKRNTKAANDFGNFNRNVGNWKHYLADLYQSDRSGHWLNRDERIALIKEAGKSLAEDQAADSLDDAQLRRMGKKTPREMTYWKLKSEIYNPDLTDEEATKLAASIYSETPAELLKVEEVPVPALPARRGPTVLQERGLQWITFEAGCGRAEIKLPKSLADRKRMKLVIAAIATIIARSKDAAFAALRELGPMSKEDMLAYGKFVRPDVLDIEFTDRQIMDVLNQGGGKPIAGWEIEEAMRHLEEFKTVLTGTKILAEGKGWTEIEGGTRFFRFLADLDIDFHGRLYYGRNLVEDRRAIEHRYRLWLGSLGMVFLSNLIQNRFLSEDLGTLRRLPPGPSEVWDAIKLFRGSWQLKRLEFFERVLGLEGRDPDATKNHLRLILRAFAELKRAGLVREWKTEGRGRATVFYFWTVSRKTLRAANPAPPRRGAGRETGCPLAYRSSPFVYQSALLAYRSSPFDRLLTLFDLTLTVFRENSLQDSPEGQGAGKADGKRPPAGTGKTEALSGPVVAEDPEEAGDRPGDRADLDPRGEIGIESHLTS